jgi:hypothetical protein
MVHFAHLKRMVQPRVSLAPVLALKRVEQALPQDTIEMTFLLFV